MSKSGMTTAAAPNGPNVGRKLPRNGEVYKKGYLKKMKTMRKKFFVLRAESPGAPACLEYYDSEKKFERHPNQPKRSIVLSTCFNISRRSDAKHKQAAVLYTGRDVFGLLFDSASELDEWLQAMLFLAHGQDLLPGEVLRPNFEHVWQVEMANRELGGNKNITGPYLLCLTEQSIKLVKTGSNLNTDKLDNVEFSIHSIRCCGDYQTFFYLEVGTATVTGPGNLWMQVEDNSTAAHMHATVLKHCMTNSKKDPHKSKDTKDNSQYHSSTRVRSPSVSEISRPIGITHPAGSLASQPYRTRTNSEGMQPLNQLLRCSYLDPSPAHFHSHSSSQHGFNSSSHHNSFNSSHPNAINSLNHSANHFSVQHHNGSQLILGSPPVTSPTSDSAGSSLSLDNVDAGRPPPHSSLSEEFTHPTQADSYVLWNAERRHEDERLNNYLTDNNLSAAYPHPHTHTHTHHMRKISPGSPTQASFLDPHHSSYGSSPTAHPPYFPMSPVSVGENKNRVLNGCLSVSHSRGSSITEDSQYDTGGGGGGGGGGPYVDMDMKKHTRRHQQAASETGTSSVLSPGTSSTSFTSGTPGSKDLQFYDYHGGERGAPPYLSAAEEGGGEDAQESNRTKRAYSVGSRPENLKNKVNKNDSQECPRTRAFSVGSKAVGGVTPRPRPPGPSSSQSSLEHSEDLMELDFSHRARHRTRGRPSSEKLAPPSSSLSSASSYSTAEGSSYLDLAPSPPSSSAPRPSLLARAFGRSPPKSSPPSGSLHFRNLDRVPETPPGYVPMRASCRGELLLASPLSSTSTLTSLPSPSPHGTPPRYMDEEEPYMDMAPCPPPAAPDYMEMSLKRKPEERGADDYMNMSAGAGTKKDRRRTQPITIASTPPLFLPLAAASPARAGRRKSVGRRGDARETPTPTIFPFSLGSPAVSPGEAESPRASEPLASVQEVADGGQDASDYVNIAPSAAGTPRGNLSGAGLMEVDDYVEMQRERRSTIAPPALEEMQRRSTIAPPALEEMQRRSTIAPPALAQAAQGKTLEQVQKKLVILGLSKPRKNPSPPPPPQPQPPPLHKEITYESLDLESSSSSSSSLASRTFTSYATIDHSKSAHPPPGPLAATGAHSPDSKT